MIKGYAPGANITLLDTMYIRPQKINDKWENDKMILVYIDNDTKEKKIECIENPDYEYFKLKPHIQPEDYNELFRSKDDVYTIKVPYTQLEKKIAEDAGLEDFYYENKRNGNNYENKKLHVMDKSIFNSDMQIDDHYRFRFSKMYKNDIIPLKKAFLDIEVDGINQRGDFPEMGECPINAVTYIDLNKNTSYTFILRNPDNPLVEEFENEVRSGNVFSELKDFVIDKVGGPKKASKFGVDKLDYQFFFYDDELKLIHDLFILININEPDFLLAWNASFDIPYIMARLELAFNLNPAEVMCHPDFPVKVARYFIDELHKNEIGERGDFATIGMKTVVTDQMIHFKSIRKATNFESLKLDYIGELVAGVRKLDYSHITRKIEQLPYLDFKTFIFYNIMDAIVQVCIESETKDIDFVFAKANLNNTRYHKCHRQTIYLTDRATTEFFEDSECVIGNNANKFKPKPEEKFPGALVGKPKNNSDYAKLKINGYAINVCDNLDDYDFKSLYPSTERENNMAPHTQIGAIQIDHQVWDKENPFKDKQYRRGGQFIEDFQCGVTIEFCNRWLHFGNFMEVLEDLKEYFTTIAIPCRPINMFPRMGELQESITLYNNKSIIAPAISIYTDTIKEDAITKLVPRKSFTDIHSDIRESVMQFRFRNEDLERI